MKISKLSLTMAMLLSGLVAFHSMTCAADIGSQSAPTAAKPAAPAKSKDPVDKLAAKMKLTDEQKAKLAPLYQERAEKLAALKAQTNREKAKIKDAFAARIKKSKVFTDAEYAEWLALQTKGASTTPNAAAGPAKPKSY